MKGRLPIIRGGMKEKAKTYVNGVFALAAGCRKNVEWWKVDRRYIYKGKHPQLVCYALDLHLYLLTFIIISQQVDMTKPYQLSILPQVIAEFFFKSGRPGYPSMAAEHLKKFVDYQKAEANMSLEVPPAMVAIAATAVRRSTFSSV